MVDYIPSGLSLVTDINWEMRSGFAYRNVGFIAAGDSLLYSISFVVNEMAKGVIINAAEISHADNDYDLEDIDSMSDNIPNNDGIYKDDIINENGKNGGDEDDHDIELISICPNGKCLSFKTVRRK